MASISVLDLSSNMLGGALPHCFFTSVSINLNVLDLHDNQFQGTIPQTFTDTCKLTTFNINNNHMEGSIPRALANCTQLQIVDFGSNKISGTFPWWLVALRELQILVLRSNRLHGKLSVGNMKHPFPKLRIMDLSHNQFSGNLPINFFESFKVMEDSDQHIGLNTTYVRGSYYEASVSLIVKGMELEVKKILYIYSSIDLSSNQFNGTIPQVIGELKSLRLLNLSHNSLTGHIPSLLGNMSLLESLDLSSNQLTGEIPVTFCKATSLLVLDLSSNGLSGTLPQCLGDLNLSLQVINLSKNQFKGTIPPKLCMSYISVLDLSSNMLGGALPPCFFTNVSFNLNILDLRDNQLHGTLPQTITNTCSLKTFNINNNHIEGLIPPALANCKQLQILDFGNNNISDFFPSWLVALSELQILVLRSNRFHGNLSVKTMEHPFPKLRIMDISHNRFTGDLPINFFDNFKLMANSDQSIGFGTLVGTYATTVQGSYYEASVSLTVKGTELEVKKILYIYASIDLSSNQFNGTIPQVIGELKSLRLLNLSHNSLTGHIPSSLGNMSLLESLDLSSNQLTGKIPSQLTSLEYLSTLNLSQNQLSGAIPQGRHFDTLGNHSYLGNLALCGVPLTKKCRVDEPSTPEVDDDADIDDDSLDWKMILIGYGSGLVIGLSTGYIVFTTGKPWRFVMLVEKAQQKLIRRYR